MAPNSNCGVYGLACVSRSYIELSQEILSGANPTCALPLAYRNRISKLIMTTLLVSFREEW